jgi:hypothetical protein
LMEKMETIEAGKSHWVADDTGIMMIITGQKEQHMCKPSSVGRPPDTFIRRHVFCDR